MKIDSSAMSARQYTDKTVQNYLHVVYMSCYFSRNAVETFINCGIFKIVETLLVENEGSDKKPSYSQAVINLIDALFPSAAASRKM